jgi:hypothetical protein
VTNDHHEPAPGQTLEQHRNWCRHFLEPPTVDDLY